MQPRAVRSSQQNGCTRMSRGPLRIEREERARGLAGKRALLRELVGARKAVLEREAADPVVRIAAHVGHLLRPRFLVLVGLAHLEEADLCGPGRDQPEDLARVLYAF